MRISYVTVCVDYLDYLTIAYRHNREHFDDFTIATASHDRDTQNWCVNNGITCVVTDEFYTRGAVFNKAAGLNAALTVLAQTNPEWFAIMDADTFVPSDWRTWLTTQQLDSEWLYGCERVLLPTYADYEEYVMGKRPIESFESPRGFGFGWFQLGHWRSQAMQSCSFGQWYPETRDCTECDWMFHLRWGKLINEYTAAEGRLGKLSFKALNLGPHGTNHRGRVAPLFSSLII